MSSKLDRESEASGPNFPAVYPDGLMPSSANSTHRPLGLNDLTKERVQPLELQMTKMQRKEVRATQISTRRIDNRL